MSGRRVAIVQARMSSGRLPGKVLLPLAGLPVILHVVERLRAVLDLDATVVSTPSGSQESPLHDLLRAEEIPFHVWHGDQDDLVGRYLAVGEEWDAGDVLMVDGDCPLIDPDTAARMIRRLRECPEAEYVRVAPWTLEGGIACLRLDTFRRLDRETNPGPYREHATLRILERPEAFRIADVPVDAAFAHPCDAHRFWLDTPADHCFLDTIFQRLQPPTGLVDLRDVVGLLRRHPELKRINAHVRQKDPLSPSRIVAFLPPCSEPSLFAELETLAAERHRLGVRRLTGPDAIDEATRLGACWLVVAAGDPRAAADALPVFEAPRNVPPERQCDELLVRLAGGVGPA